MARFAPGQVVTVFRSRLRADAPDYAETADRMAALAAAMPGFVEAKSFTAADGERVTVVTFESEEAQRRWREHPEHRAAQARGRAAWYERYSLQVATCTRVHEHDATSD